ncbi:MAG: hypothetical protein JXP73_15515 [Deltaproteobacteria bacterium]|nr:hypothetical protein [Deltaproteobacteria bacterium]
MTDTEGKPPLDFPELESGGDAAPADEFASIRSPRRRHPIIALAAAALAALLLYQIHDDLFYALSHSEPRDLGDARTLAGLSLDRLPLNRYVRVTGMADRESSVILDTAGSWRFSQFFRLLGTKSRIFVRRVPDPLPVEQAEKDVYVGRLVPFRDLSFQAAIRKHFANRVSATHFFAPAAVRDKVAATNGGPVVLADRMGERVSLAPNDEIAIDVRRPTDVHVEMPRSKWPDEAVARAAIERRGGRVVDEAAQATDRNNVALIVRFPEEGRDRAMNAVSELDPRIRYLPVRKKYKTRIAMLFAAEDGLRIKVAGADEVLPLASILSVSTLANVHIPDDAVLLREGERPRDQFKILIVGAFLLGFALLNLLALRARA